MESGKKKITQFKLSHKAEQWCNRRDRMGCRVSRCMEKMENPAECNRLLRVFKECIKDRKEQLLEKYYVE